MIAPSLQLTSGHRQALAELRRIVSADRALTIVSVRQGPEGYILVDVSVDCSNLRAVKEGIPMRARERLTIGVPAQFPFEVPFVRTPRARWVGTPHVQWGHQLCLYLSPATEWNPADGMAGFIERLMLWLERAAAGELDAPGEPLHPPLAYPSRTAGIVVAKENAPRAADGAPWVGVALLNQVSSGRVDIVGWLRPTDPWPETAQAAHEAARIDVKSASVVLGLAIILPQPIAFEYPHTAAAMVEALKPYGMDTEVFLGMLGIVARINRDLTALNTTLDPDQPGLPLYLVVGTPTRGTVGLSERVTHLAVWRLPPIAEQIAHLVPKKYSDLPDVARTGHKILGFGQQWLGSAETAWARVYEARPEVVVSRDAETSAAWLVGKSVLVLGVGALGAPLAEACVRSGASRVVVADNGVVHPGILVRQPYYEADIGRYKVVALAERLRRIHADAIVEPLHSDVVKMMLNDTAAPPFDLVIDATANRIVRTVIERRWRVQRDAWPPIATVLIGHDARRGIATVSHPGSSGAAVDVLRRLSLAARTDTTGELADVVNDLFPDPPRAEFFQPEPGCSDVTFVGSAAEVVGLAGHLLAGMLHALADNSEKDGMLALVVRMPGAPTDAPTGGARWFRWPSDFVLQTADRNHEVRVARSAVAEMRAEARRGARVQGDRIETGGSLLGAFDEAAGVVWVDHATGPPPDSLLSAEHFQHGTEGVEARIAAQGAATARVTVFVGMWHSHPHGEAAPSHTDEVGMRQLVVPVKGAPPRALLLIVGGRSERWRQWLAAGTQPDWYARVVERAPG